MSEGVDGARNPFDLFGTSVQRDGAPPATDLSELMRNSELPRVVDRSPAEVDVEPAPTREADEPTGTPSSARAPAPSEPTAAAPDVETVRPSPALSPAFRETPQPTFSEPEVESVSAPRHSARPIRPPEPIDTRKLWVLRLLLISNVAMMLLMLVLPHPLEPRQEYISPEAAAERAARNEDARPVTGDPYVGAARRGSLALPDDALYEKAMLLALDGDFDGACKQLEKMLAESPAMNPAVARLVHAHLGYYLRKAGRLTEAMEHETLARQEAGRSQQPEELLQQARAAEVRGDGDGMRRAYAQFLLQEGQLSPDMRALVPEALLKLGDSYRVKADVGASAGAEKSR